MVCLRLRPWTKHHPTKPGRLRFCGTSPQPVELVDAVCIPSKKTARPNPSPRLPCTACVPAGCCRAHASAPRPLLLLLTQSSFLASDATKRLTDCREVAFRQVVAPSHLDLSRSLLGEGRMAPQKLHGFLRHVLLLENRQRGEVHLELEEFKASVKKFRGSFICGHIGVEAGGFQKSQHLPEPNRNLVQLPSRLARRPAPGRMKKRLVSRVLAAPPLGWFQQGTHAAYCRAAHLLHSPKPKDLQGLRGGAAPLQKLSGTGCWKSRNPKTGWVLKNTRP